MKKIFTLTFIFTFSFFISKAQLFVDTSYSVQQMMEDFFDTTDVVISNITYTGPNVAAGFFDAGNTNLGLNAGIMFTSGTVFNAVGPNVSSSISGFNNSVGDEDLGTLSAFPTYDASVVEFDIVPPSDTLSFKYVFASDEYTEYANTAFNDVFAFFLTGPGYNDQNIALIPGSSLPASINNINCLDGSPYYVCNDPENTLCAANYDCPTDYLQTTIEYDGFTTALPIHAIVQAGATYHVKIGVADASDGIFDSGVFLSIESLGGADSLACSGDHTKDVNGNQVKFIDHSKYASHWYWDFGDGTFSTERNPVHTYVDLANNGYIVKQKVWNFCCADSFISGVGNYLAVENLLSNPLSMSPNPVSTVLNIYLNEGSQGDLYLFDITGKLLLSKNITSDLQLDMSSFDAGIYIVEFADGKQVHHQKIIKK